LRPETRRPDDFTDGHYRLPTADGRRRRQLTTDFNADINLMIRSELTLNVSSSRAAAESRIAR
jgi:hypothetical protein